jgi:hypothetical protein
MAALTGTDCSHADLAALVESQDMHQEGGFDEAEKMIRFADEDGDGLISFFEFCAVYLIACSGGTCSHQSDGFVRAVGEIERAQTLEQIRRTSAELLAACGQPGASGAELSTTLDGLRKLLHSMEQTSVHDTALPQQLRRAQQQHGGGGGGGGGPTGAVSGAAAALHAAALFNRTRLRDIEEFAQELELEEAEEMAEAAEELAWAGATPTADTPRLADGDGDGDDDVAATDTDTNKAAGSMVVQPPSSEKQQQASLPEQATTAPLSYGPSEDLQRHELARLYSLFPDVDGDTIATMLRESGSIQATFQLLLDVSGAADALEQGSRTTEIAPASAPAPAPGTQAAAATPSAALQAFVGAQGVSQIDAAFRALAGVCGLSAAQLATGGLKVLASLRQSLALTAGGGGGGGECFPRVNCVAVPQALHARRANRCRARAAPAGREGGRARAAGPRQPGRPLVRGGGRRPRGAALRRRARAVSRARLPVCD